MGRKQALFHGDDRRFDDLADFVGNYFTNNVKYIADVAGGQGMLSRLLKKKYNFECEVIDPREYSLKGVFHRKTYFKVEMAAYYDLLLGLHPDGALPELVLASIIRPTLIVPCCNFWSPCRMGIKEMIADIQCWYKEHEVSYDIVCFPFSGPYNIGMITTPPISSPVKIREVGSHLNKSDQITEIRGARRQFKAKARSSKFVKSKGCCIQTNVTSDPGTT